MSVRHGMMRIKNNRRQEIGADFGLSHFQKGNIHCHSTFSDGNLFPEMLKYSYKHHGFDFLVVTDHDHPPFSCNERGLL